MTATIESSCPQCGVATERERIEGVLAEKLNAIDVLCGPCCEVEERTERRDEVLRAGTERVARVKRRRSRSGVPGHLWEWSFADVHDQRGIEDAMVLARRWATGESSGVLLIGTVGTGKTRLAVAAVNGLLERRSALYFSAPTLMARLGSGDFASPARAAALEALTGNLPLVLDDIDKARPTPYAAEAMFAAVDQRADGAAPLMVTTNLSLGELAGRWPDPYGEALASRLALLERAQTFGPDRRTS